MVGQTLVKKRTLRNWAFFLLYLSLSAILFANYNTLPNLTYFLADASLAEIPLIYMMGPSIFLIINSSLDKKTSYIWAHFLLPLASAVALIPYFSLPTAEKAIRLAHTFQGQEIYWHDWLYGIGLVVSFIYMMYFIRTASSVWDFKILKTEASVQQVTLVLVLSAVVLIFALLSVLLRDHIYFRVSASVLTFVVLGSFLMGFRYPDYFQNFVTAVTQSKSAPSLLDKLDLDDLNKKIGRLMEVDKIYYDESLTLAKLSKRLEISIHQLSQFLNRHLQKNFSSYVNTYRVNEAKLLLEQHEKLNIQAIAYKVGFSSKPSFNRAFLNSEGISPKEYRQRALKK